ncbi:hypothetical protein SAMN02745157_0458 [Kaistia soli DSM 19436]|uniref:Uncharacterized protein n=1 Tax=Kaistia soli DSM 19436 TaxID=1122133 RepID=A0A1M4UIX7_9HYPH|nr:DUF6502 family protein [Kaistia soli]SHE56608.1 hypothetical protein SAMN02745157_0458 [Kaistia soli DSM 19436]
MTEKDGTGLDAGRLQAPLARLLRPLVRLAIRSGLTFPALVDLLRELYVNVAENDFALTSKSQTDSRVSLLTGIHRKEVSRLRGAGAPVNVVPVSISRTSRILARWLADSDFSDGAGRPRPLPRTGSDLEPTFDRLVESVTRDVRPRVVLDEWLDRGLVTRDADDRIVLAEQAFIPKSGSDQQLYYLGRNLHDHIAAAVANVEGDRPRFLERAVHYDGLTQPIAEMLEKRSREIAMEALTTANREAHTATEGISDGGWRWNFGVYVYSERVGGDNDETADRNDREGTT